MPKASAVVSGNVVVATQAPVEVKVTFDNRQIKLSEDQFDKTPHESWMTRISKKYFFQPKPSRASEEFLEQLQFLRESYQEIRTIVDQKWPLLWPESLAIFLQQYQELEKAIAENPSEKVHGENCEDLKKEVEILLHSIAETKQRSLRAAIQFSTAPVKEGIKVCGLLSALAEKDIERFTGFVDGFKIEQLRKKQAAKMPTEQWILSNLSKVILSRLVEAKLLQVMSNEEFRKIKTEVKTLDVLKAAIAEVEQELGNSSSFGKWKKELGKKSSLKRIEDSDLNGAYVQWLEVKKSAKDNLSNAVHALEEKSALLKRIDVLSTTKYYTEHSQRNLIADLVFLPAMCQYEHAQWSAHDNIVKNLLERDLLLLEKLNVAEKRDRLSANPDENHGLVKRNQKYYRFSERALRELADAILLEVTLS